MSRFLRSVQNDLPEKDISDLSENDLQRCGITGIELKPYQLDGVRWLSQCLQTLGGCILADEMGLGKTAQTICLLAYARGQLEMDDPFMVLCPLTVVGNWKTEFKRFCPRLRVVCYEGDRTERARTLKKMDKRPFHVLLSHYEAIQKDGSSFRRWHWQILVVDEAHRLKNQLCQFYQLLNKLSLGFRILLTGTPIQNNLREVYSLLTFIQPDVFPPDATTEFVEAYINVQTQSRKAEELHQVLQPFLLRRVKAEVMAHLPKKMEVVVYHGMSAKQKNVYREILTAKHSVNSVSQEFAKGLQNTLMQLRKCVCHPYLFKGQEPPPYQIGEHLVEASGKLSLLDSMLQQLHSEGHRVLLFSQMAIVLDVLQDYVAYRGYTYERLDGSVRAAERRFHINNFKTQNIFIFLLSTKAGGVGLNLEEADTVILYDSDFNPQNDQQAIGRAHRIGQTRAVKVFRLLGKDTVEEIIFSRALAKLRLTNTVIEGGQFSQEETPPELKDMLKYGVHNLLSSGESTVQRVDIQSILGESQEGQWVINEEDLVPPEEEEDNDEERQTHMYIFEGKDYSKKPSMEDESAFRLIMGSEASSSQQRTKSEGRSLRNKSVVLSPGILPTSSRQKRPLTESELEERRRKRGEAAAKRAKLQDEKKKQRDEKKYQKKMAWWESCGYKSVCLPSIDSEGEDVDEEEDDNSSSVNPIDSDELDIRYILGDVTHPKARQEDAIIIHCVDDSGYWGQGGLFTALALRTDEAKKNYELAGDMKDLELGSVLLFPINDKETRLFGKDYLALIVTQRKDKDNKPSEIYSALEKGLKKIYKAAKEMEASVHLPRIGHATKGFEWYSTERLIRSHFASKGIPTLIYYYKRGASNSTRKASTTDTATPSTSRAALTLPSPVSPSTLSSLSSPGSLEERDESSEVPSTSQQGRGASTLPEFMSGVHVFFYNIGVMERKTLARYLIAYNGDEENFMNSQVTHIVAEVESPVHQQELQQWCQQYDQAILVKPKWLSSCFANQRRVRTSKFLHHLT